MFVLLSKHNAAMLNTCASHLNEVSVICADNASHLYGAIQLLQITFTKASQVAHSQDIDTPPYQLTGDFDIKLFVKIEAKVCHWQCVRLSIDAPS